MNFFNFYLFLILLTTSLKFILTQGVCGPSNSTNTTTPTSASDCVSYSNATDFCCFLKASNSPASFSMCISMKSDDVFSLLSIGNIVYRVNCTGLPNFDEYFPFEGEYNACGNTNPQSAYDCWAYNNDASPCCISSLEPTFNSTYNPLCYFYPKNNNFEIRNFTETNKNGRKLYFSCDPRNVIMNSFKFLIVLVFLIL